jgi:hypothetical protein
LALVVVRSNRIAPDRRIVRIGVGRDAADVAFATLVGSARLRRAATKRVWRLQTPIAGVVLTA